MARCTVLASVVLAIAPWTAAGQSFIVSGRITAGISSLQGVTLSGLPGDPVTDATGNYSATVPAGFSGTVTPTKTGYAFIPASRTYTNVGGDQTAQDYTASSGTFTISGRVTAGTSSLQGVTLSGLPGDPVTDATGNYTATVAAGFSGTVTPSKAGYAFTPASRTYTNVSSNQTSQDYTGSDQTCTISGRVTAGISSLQGVTLSGLPGDPVTDATGNYTATVPSGFSGTVTPTKAGYAFTPASRTYNNVTSNQTGQDYTASSGTFSISGRVTAGISSLQGVTLSGLPGDPVTDATGNYTATVPSGFSGTVTPTKAGYAFTPASRTYNNVASNQTGQNYTASSGAFTISGRVTAGISSLQGVTLSGLPGDPVTDATGNYTATVPSGFSGTVTPTKAGYAFTPTSRTYTNITSNQTSQNYAGTVATCPTWYHDSDGDTYGNAADSVVSCTDPPVGYVSDSTDCDDQNAAIHPGAAEVCGNGIDDDCLNGDELCSGTWYRDADGDQYGNPAESTASLSQPAGYVSENTDCDDNRSDVHPGMAEVCEDGVDNNCDGQVDEGCADPPTPLNDADQDGVADETDVCPGTAAGDPVNAEGCAAGQRDSDGDGVTDDLDQCPGTPPGTEVDNEGCALRTPAESPPTVPAAPCGSGAATGTVGIMTGLALMPRRRSRPQTG